MHTRPWTSLLALRSFQWSGLILLVLAVGSVPESGISDGDLAAFVDRTTRRWCQEHGKRDDLQAVVVDVRFLPEPPLFAEGEGVVAAPLALDLPGAQRLLDVASQPAHVRRLSVQGITTLAWEYGGRVHREMRFAGLALVERPPLARVSPPGEPTFDEMLSDQKPGTLARASDLEEHSLHECAAFPDWARRTAGAGPYTEQVLRLARAVAKPDTGKRDQPDDLCAAIREERFTPHRSQVAVVMAARELGIPALGFASASDREIYLVGTYTDQMGWILLDVEHPEEGWFTGGPPLVTLAPLLAGFEASRHDFWRPESAAYARTAWGTTTVSRTDWRGRLEPDHARTDTTEARALRLSEVCP